jgi:hypothetical protein
MLEMWLRTEVGAGTARPEIRPERLHELLTMQSMEGARATS